MGPFSGELCSSEHSGEAVLEPCPPQSICIFCAEQFWGTLRESTASLRKSSLGSPPAAFYKVTVSRHERGGQTDRQRPHTRGQEKACRTNTQATPFDQLNP